MPDEIAWKSAIRPGVYFDVARRDTVLAFSLRIFSVHAVFFREKRMNDEQFSTCDELGYNYS